MAVASIGRFCIKCHQDEWYVYTKRLRCAICQRTWNRKWRADNKEYPNAYFKLRREQDKNYQLDYRRDYHREYRRNNINARIADNLRSRLNKAVLKDRDGGSAVSDLGCSIARFKLYIENQFELGMSWDNYGKWHLDHVLPLSSFDLTERAQFLEACNWLNYQPLWARDNIVKGASI